MVSYTHAHASDLSQPPDLLSVSTERAVTTDGRYMFPVELVQGRFQAGEKKKKPCSFLVLFCPLVLCVMCRICVNTSDKN